MSSRPQQPRAATPVTPRFRSTRAAYIGPKRDSEGNVRLRQLFDVGETVSYDGQRYSVTEFKPSNAQKQYTIQKTDRTITVAGWKLKGDLGWNALHSAVKKGLVNEMRFLCTKLDIEAKESREWTALILAAHFGRTDCLNALLAKGATIEAKDKDGRTALMIAATKGRTDCLNALLDRRANIEAKTNKGWTALMLATGQGHTGCLNALLDRRANIEAKNNKGWTALMLAAGQGHTGCLNALLDRRANIEASANAGWTALMLAVLFKRIDCFNALLARGANTEVKNNDGETALMLATRTNQMEWVRLLTAAKANIDDPDELDQKVDAALAKVSKLYDERRLKRTQDYEYEVSLLHDQSKPTQQAREARLQRAVEAKPELRHLLDERNQLKENVLKLRYEAALASLAKAEAAERAKLEAQRAALRAKYSKMFVEDHRCVVCREVKESLGLAFDCGHRVCKGCAPSVVGRKCPVCRKVSNELRPIYASVRSETKLSRG